MGTATEVHDYLRLLWSRVGRTHCPECARWVKPDTVSTAVDRTNALVTVVTTHPGVSNDEESVQYNGLLMERTSASGKTVTFGYDGVGRQTRANGPPGASACLRWGNRYMSQGESCGLSVTAMRSCRFSNPG